MRPRPHRPRTSPIRNSHCGCRTSSPSPSRSPEACRSARSSPTRQFASAFSPGMHGTTFGGGPLICATALEFLTIIEDDDLARQHSRARRRTARRARKAWPAQFDFIREVRGEGLILGVDLSIDGAPYRRRSPARRPAHQLHARTYPASAAAVHHPRAQTSPNFSPSFEKAPEASTTKARPPPKHAKPQRSAADGSGCREVMKHEHHRCQPHRSCTNDLLTGMEWSPAQLRELLHLAADVKAHPDRYRGALAGRFLALIFEKPSLRTRVTFEVGIASLGGSRRVSRSHRHASRRARIHPRRREKPRALGARHRRARVQAGIAR